jgi:hypothetical protein
MKTTLNGGKEKVAPSKPKTKPGKIEKPNTPYKPGVGPQHKPKA